MTRNQLRVANLFDSLQRMSKIDFPPEFLIRQMHRFPIMYKTMGSKVDDLAMRDHFLAKNCLKEPESETLNPSIDF